jgi:hypothetical protein
MKKIFLLILFIIHLSTICLAGGKDSTKFIRFNLGVGVGYKTNTSELLAISFGCRLNKNIELNVGPYFNFFYSGPGITSGIKVYYLLDKKVFLNTELSYRHRFSKEISISNPNHDSDVGNYFIPSNDFFFIVEGINILLKDKSLNDSKKRKGKLNLSICYGFTPKKYNWTFVKGIPSSENEKQIDRILSGGLGFSIMYCPGFLSY